MKPRQADKWGGTRSVFRVAAISAAVVAALGASNAVVAFEINTGNEDIVMRWDNTLRYNLGVRAQKQDKAILGNVNSDDGDRNFSNGSVVTNRADILSEFDVVWKRQYGFRVSGAGWYDQAYSGGLDNTNTLTANTLVNGLPSAGTLNPYTKRYARGASGEFLDAFVFANLDIGGMPLSIKAGQHTVYWGESLLFGGILHGITYGQNSIDAWKAQSTPGAEAKELFRPRGGLTVQMQPRLDLSIAAQWFYNWQAVRAQESGAYLSNNDMLNFGGDSLIVGANPFAAAIPGSPGLLRFWNTQNVPNSKYNGSLGDWGLATRWSPDWLDGTLGFYYRNTTDVLPGLMVIPGTASIPAATCTAIGGTVLAPTTCLVNKNATTVADLQKYGKAGLYQTFYGNNIQLFGLSLSKNIEGVAIGAEVSYRQNMPLVSDPVAVVVAPLVPGVPGSISTNSIPAHGDSPAALGNTWHGLVNGIGILPKTPLFDTASVTAELAWMYLAKVTQNEAVYKGRANYSLIDKPTKSYWQLAVNFTPTWFQVLPSVDLTMPITWSQGIAGNAATTFGGNEDAGSWSAGFGATIYQKYLVNLTYIGYYGNYTTGPTGAMVTPNGTNAAISDRGWVSLTLKTTF